MTDRAIGIKAPNDKFAISKDLAGLSDDSVHNCEIHPSVCQPCTEFLRDFLETKAWNLKDKSSRWERRVFRKRCCKDEISFRWVYHRYESLQDLENPVSQTCPLCREARRVTEMHQRGPIVFTSGEAIEFEGHAARSIREPQDSLWGTAFSIHSLWELDEAADLIDQERQYSLVVAREWRDALAPPGQRSTKLLTFPNLDSSSEECFSKLFQWVSECTSSHAKCSRPKLPLPSRLLDVCPEGRSEDFIVLEETESWSQSTVDQTKYLALSYCWGRSHNYKTLKANLRDHLTSIGMEKLPMLIQNAVTITRRCKVKYLWIDAICIVQDDPEDWAMEASRMGDVYAGSVFTISALSSSDSSQPILGPRNLVGFEVAKITNTKSLAPERLWIRSALESLPIAFMSQPLASRAWCYQERQLAPGFIHYGNNELIWECNTLHLRTEMGSHFDYLPRYQTMSRLTDVSRWVSERQLWDSLVVNFTQLDITYHSDRVIAMSGLAARFRQTGQLRGRYVAGMWEDDLLYQLLWSVHHWEEQRRVGGFDASAEFPSWSWASSNREINPPGWRDSGAEGTLEGRPRFHLKGKEQEQRSLGIGKTLDTCEIMIEGYVSDLDIAMADSNGNQIELTRTSPEIPGGFWSWDHQPYSTTDRLYCLRMLHCEFPRISCDGSAVVWLVLTKVEQVQQQHLSDFDVIDAQLYRRVGLLTVRRLPAEHFKFPWPDLRLDGGTAMLTHGRWEDVVLI